MPKQGHQGLTDAKVITFPETANQFKTIIWRTTPKSESTTQKDESTIQKDESTIQKDESTIQKDESTIQKDESTTQKDNKVLIYGVGKLKSADLWR